MSTAKVQSQIDMDFKTPNGAAITCWEEWTRPKRDYQWKAGRSAMELARSWFREGQLAPPEEFQKLLSSAPRLTALQLARGVPELVTKLPERGEGRNHDLWLLGRTPIDQVTICVEAKADEPFGDSTTGEYLRKSKMRLGNGERTRVPNRIEALIRILDSKNQCLEDSPWMDVQYQLLTAICGTVLQAKLDGSSLAVLVIHVFESSSTEQEKLALNEAAFTKFVRLLAKVEESEIGKAVLSGPIQVDGVECLVGKTQVKILANDGRL